MKTVTRTGTTMPAAEHPGMQPTILRVMQEAYALKARAERLFPDHPRLANHLARTHIRRATRRYGLHTEYVNLTRQFA